MVPNTSYRLENLPEIERENILASRLEEMQKFKDSQALDAMFKTAHGGDDEEEDDSRARKRREPFIIYKNDVLIDSQANTPV